MCEMVSIVAWHQSVLHATADTEWQWPRWWGTSLMLSYVTPHRLRASQLNISRRASIHHRRFCLLMACMVCRWSTRWTGMFVKFRSTVSVPVLSTVIVSDTYDHLEYFACYLWGRHLCLCRKLLRSQDAKLVYDVVKFDAKFRSVVLHCVGTAVVCETNDAAELLAWNTDQRCRVTVPYLLNSIGVLYEGTHTLTFWSTVQYSRFCCYLTKFSQ